MGIKEKPSSGMLKDFRNQIEEQFQGLQGSWLPSTVRMGGQTYRYQPSIGEQYGVSRPRVDPMAQLQAQEKFNQWQQQNNMAPKSLPAQTEPIQPKSPFGNQPIKTPMANSKEYQALRKAIQIAIEKRIPLDEVISGIKKQGFNPMDFHDLFFQYATPEKLNRRSFFDRLLRGVGFNDDVRGGVREYLEQGVEQRKRDLMGR